MNRILILVCVCTLAGATPYHLANYPTNLGWLFGFNKKAAAEPLKEPEVCDTEECKLIAKVIKESMDDTVDPCDDFYEYACGNWANNNEIPEGEDSWDLWHMVMEKISEAVYEIISDDSKPDDVLPVKLGKKWYRVCMNTDNIEKEGLQPLLRTMNRIGGWPLIMDPDEWDEKAFHWQRVDDYYARLGHSNVFYDVVVHPFFTDENMIGIGPPHLPSRSYRLYAGDDGDDGDDSNENESEEKEQEPGSEQEDKNEEDKKEEEEEEEEEENEEDNEVSRSRKKVSRRKSVGKVGHAKKSKNKSRVLKKHGEKKLKRRSKRRANIHLNKVSHKKQQKRHKKESRHNVAHHSNKIRIPKHKKLEEEKNEENSGKSGEKEQNENTSGTDQKENDSGIENESENESKNESEGDKEKEDEEENGDQKDDDDDDDDSEDGDGDSTEESAEQNREVYKKFILDVAKLLAAERDIEISEEKMIKDIEDLVAFQVKLVGLYFMDDEYVNMTLNEFQETYDANEPTSRGKVNWLKKLKRQFSEAEVELTGDELALIACLNFMNGLASLLDETPTETIVNYIHWNFVSNMMMATTKPMRDLFVKWNFQKEPKIVQNRTNWCVSEMEMHDVVAYEFAKKYFSKDVKKLALDVIDDIQKEVEYQIKESEWMDEYTKDFILDKLVNLERLVGYPDWYDNATAVKRFFKGVTIGPSYYENVLSFMRYTKWKNMRSLVDQTDSEEWQISPMTLNAFFMPTENSITITAADFQNPFFALRRPQSINYGIIGFVMAHEVNHGFDNSGHLYNKNGKEMEWLSAMAAAYNKRAECFVDQFNGYSVLRMTNLTIKNYGNQTAGENIADTMGLQSVYRAYQRRQRECGKVDPPLPGLEKFTNEQLFFLSFASLWCEATGDPEQAARMARFDEHSTGRLRVIGSVSNSEDFAKAYNCPVGSPMNPKKKCNIWK